MAMAIKMIEITNSSFGEYSIRALARPLASFVGPGFSGAGELDTLARLIRIILPAQFFLVVGGLLSAALQAQDRHLLPAMAPLVYSAGIIAGGLRFLLQPGAHFRRGTSFRAAARICSACG